MRGGVGIPDDPSHSQESLETLSAVAAHLCLVFLMAGCGGGGGVHTLLRVRFLSPLRNPLLFICTHTHTHTSDSVEDCSLCYGIWEAPLQLLPSVQTVSPAPRGFYFPFSLTPSLPPLLTCPCQPLNEWPPFFFPELSALLTIELWELFIRCALIFFVWPSTLLSLPITCSALPHPWSLAQTVV